LSLPGGVRQLLSRATETKSAQKRHKQETKSKEHIVAFNVNEFLLILTT